MNPHISQFSTLTLPRNLILHQSSGPAVSNQCCPWNKETEMGGVLDKDLGTKRGMELSILHLSFLVLNFHWILHRTAKPSTFFKIVASTRVQETLLQRSNINLCKINEFL